MISALPLEIQKHIWNLYIATIRKACFIRQLKMRGWTNRPCEFVKPKRREINTLDDAMYWILDYEENHRYFDCLTYCGPLPGNHHLFINHLYRNVSGYAPQYWDKQKTKINVASAEIHEIRRGGRTYFDYSSDEEVHHTAFVCSYDPTRNDKGQPALRYLRQTRFFKDCVQDVIDNYDFACAEYGGPDLQQSIYD